jgi:hypothetical protein
MHTLARPFGVPAARPSFPVGTLAPRIGTLAPRIGTLLPCCTWSAQGWSGPSAAQRAHPAGSRT